MAVNKPAFDFKAYREGRIQQAESALVQQARVMRRESFHDFMARINAGHESVSDASARTDSEDEFLRTPTVEIRETPISDSEKYKQELESILPFIPLLKQRLTIEVHNMRRDETQGLTVLGKLLLKGLKWWNKVEKPLLEKQLEALPGLEKEVHNLLKILYTLTASVSETLQRRCDACLGTLHAIKNGPLRVIEIGND